jgi:hypothetical protein
LTERVPYMKKKESYCETKNIEIWSWPQRGPDTKTNWPTDRRSQYNLNLKIIIIRGRGNELTTNYYYYCKRNEWPLVHVTSDHWRSAKTSVRTSWIYSLASSSSTEEHVSSSEHQWRASSPAVFLAATPPADSESSRPATSSKSRPVTARAPPVLSVEPSWRLMSHCVQSQEI